MNEVSDPIGTRTQVTRMRTWCPGPLDDGAVPSILAYIHRFLWGLSMIDILTLASNKGKITLAGLNVCPLSLQKAEGFFVLDRKNYAKQTKVN
jgi:hypothetical protein